MVSENMPSLLIIDDDEDIRDVVTVLFEDDGWQVDALGDGIDALEVKKAYDVILLDLNMPVFDGERLADYWAVANPDILRRVVVLSGYSRFTKGRSLNAFAMVPKPFEMTALLTIVRSCRDSRASEHPSG